MSYPPAPGYYETQQPRRGGSGLAIAALVLGVLALITSWTVIGGVLCGLLAIGLGFVASSRAKRGMGGGRGMAIAGIVLGALGLVVAIALVSVGLSFLNSDSGQQLQECLRKAGDDVAAQEQCQRQFQEGLEDQAG